MSFDLPQYPPLPPVQPSIERDSAFSKPGTTKAGKWAPAKGTRFRSTLEKTKGPRRKRKPDIRQVKFY